MSQNTVACRDTSWKEGKLPPKSRVGGCLRGTASHEEKRACSPQTLTCAKVDQGAVPQAISQGVSQHTANNVRAKNSRKP